ncbi:MAG: hypothetical protein JWN44_5778 [Myxococcales bacterium]|nr:hypothetical protein [Myxococcales bacterium]
MRDDDQILEDVLTRLRSAFGVSVQILEKRVGGLALQVGATDGAVISIRVKDPSRPNFAVSYPTLRVRKDGSRYVHDVDVDGVLLEGIEWIVGQLAQRGVVPPEFE